MHCALCSVSVRFAPLIQYALQYSVQHRHTQVIKWVTSSVLSQSILFYSKWNPLHCTYATLYKMLLSYCLFLIAYYSFEIPKCLDL